VVIITVIDVALMPATEVIYGKFSIINCQHRKNKPGARLLRTIYSWLAKVMDFVETLHEAPQISLCMVTN